MTGCIVKEVGVVYESRYNDWLYCWLQSNDLFIVIIIASPLKRKMCGFHESQYNKFKLYCWDFSRTHNTIIRYCWALRILVVNKWLIVVLHFMNGLFKRFFRAFILLITCTDNVNWIFFVRLFNLVIVLMTFFNRYVFYWHNELGIGTSYKYQNKL